VGITGRHRGTLFASLLVACAPAARGFEVAPAWGGRYLPGEPTEVSLRVPIPEGGKALLRVEGTGGRIERDVISEPGRTLEVSLPAYPGADGWLDVSVLGPDGQRQAHRVVLLPQAAPIAAAVGGPVAVPVEGARGVAVPGRDLPRTAAGYRPLASLTLAQEALVGLDGPQTAVLADYLAGCGTLVIPDADPRLLAAVRATAGCGGRTVGADGAALEPPPPLPATERLAAALPRGTDADDLWLLFLPYLLIVAGLVVSPRRIGAWVIGLPPAAALAYAGMIPQTVPPAAAVTWADARMGDGPARFVTLLRTQGAGGETPPIALPARGVLAMPATAAGRVRLDAEGNQHLSRPVELLSHTDYRLEGAVALPFRLEVVTDGPEPQVRNGGSGASPAGWLVRSGQASAFPALQPGQGRPLSGEHDAGAPLAVPMDSATTGILLRLPAALPAGLDGSARGAGSLLVRLPGEVR
jgi:hypothetical protein